MLHIANSSKRRGTASLDSLNLSEGQASAVEALGEVAAVKVEALRRGNRAQGRASVSADASISTDGLAEGTKLLGVVTVGRERSVGRLAPVGRERLRGSGGVRLRRVVDGRRNSASADEANGRSALGMLSSLAEDSGGEHCDGCRW